MANCRSLIEMLLRPVAAVQSAISIQQSAIQVRLSQLERWRSGEVANDAAFNSPDHQFTNSPTGLRFLWK
jgi:hypothetical protein